ncbi:MAG: metalloregulator ArsR/SmtB family transcription factor [Verrucomicrobia bacterium]|nr:metalloregulator ArsR/SmtB family transcription factor [Verrucomicrobiota bacterium]
MSSTLNSLRVLADPTRARLLHLLETGELTVAEIQSVLEMGQSRISTHLSQLKRAGLVQDRRVGKNSFYSWAAHGVIPQPELKRLLQLVIAEIPEAKRDRSGLVHVLNKRRDQAREYFDRLAGKFGRSYCPGRSWQGLAHLLLSLTPPMDVADLGAGEGTLSELLARRARSVIAVDLSEKMVEFGARQAQEHGISNLEYRLGDIEDPPIAENSVDLAIFSQALHHAANPARAVQAAHRILRSSGRIVVLDLLGHNFEQARELYADFWLGFSEVDLLGFLRSAGFVQNETRVVYREPESPFFQTVLATGTKA